MTFLYSLHGRNISPSWRVSRRNQGVHVRWMVDVGYWWFGWYFRR